MGILEGAKYQTLQADYNGPKQQWLQTEICVLTFWPTKLEPHVMWPLCDKQARL